MLPKRAAVRNGAAIALVAIFARGMIGAPPAAVAVGSVSFEQRIWGLGSLPTLTFSVTPRRGPLEKVLALLYVSEQPEAFLTSPFPPQMVGIVVPPASLQVVVDRQPERGPINAFSREKFVQGALFDANTGEFLGTTNEDYLDITYDAPPITYSIDFETEDDFTTPLVNGQDLSTPPEFGQLFSLSTLQPPSGAMHHGAAIFDSDPLGPNRFGQDLDLLVDSGNLVILQENGVQTTAGIFDKPDDAANGGTLVFDFTGFEFIEKVEPVSIVLVDIDTGSPGPTKVELTDVLGKKRSYTVPAGWTEDVSRDGGPGKRTLDLTSLADQPGFQATATASEATGYIPGEVVRLTVTFGGSGAVDDLVFRREADPGALVGGRGPRRGTTPVGGGTRSR